MRVKCLAQEHNAVPRSGLAPLCGTFFYKRLNELWEFEAFTESLCRLSKFLAMVWLSVFESGLKKGWQNDMLWTGWLFHTQSLPC